MDKKRTAVQFLKSELHLDWDDSYYIEVINKALQMEQEQIEEVAMYHKDSAVEIECIRSYIKKNYGGQDESK